MPVQQLDQAETAERDATTSLQQAREQEAAAVRAIDTDAAAKATVRARAGGARHRAARARRHDRARDACRTRRRPDRFDRRDGRAVAGLFTLVNNEEWFAVANFREFNIDAIAVGDCATVYSMIDRGKPIKGVVQGIGSGVLDEDRDQSAALGSLRRAFAELGEGRAALSRPRPPGRAAAEPDAARRQRRRRDEAWR